MSFQRSLTIVILIFGMLVISSSEAQVRSASNEPIQFISELEETRFNALIEELRCMVCQNQSLKDSDAPLAQDLRNEILGQLRDNRTDQEIKAFLVERYGEFVLYRPPLTAATVALWLGPFVLLLLGAFLLLRSIRRQQARTTDE